MIGMMLVSYIVEKRTRKNEFETTIHLINSTRNGSNKKQENYYGTHRHNPPIHHSILSDDLGQYVFTKRKKTFVSCRMRDKEMAGIFYHRSASVTQFGKQWNQQMCRSRHEGIGSKNRRTAISITG